MKKLGYWKIKFICLFLCLENLAVAGETKNREKCHSGRIDMPNGSTHRDENVVLPPCGVLELVQNQRPTRGRDYSIFRDSSGMTSYPLDPPADTKFDHPSHRKNLSDFPPLSLYTNSLQLPTKGNIRLYTGFELRPNWQAPITRATGDLYRFGTLRCDFGLAENVMIQIRGAVKQVLKSNGKTIASDAGDFSIATIARLLSEKSNRPALGFRLETKLPNTNQDRGIGANTTDITMAILATKNFRSFTAFSDIGLVILTAPRQINDQNDALVYGLGLMWNLNKKIQFAGEINGFTSPRDQIPLGTEDRSAARLGLTWRLPKLALEIVAINGLTEREGNWGVIAGASWQLNLFTLRGASGR